jgi:hypothetical protein
MTDHTEVLANLTDEQLAALKGTARASEAFDEALKRLGTLRLVDATLQVMIAECRAQKTCSSQARTNIVS